MFEFISRLFRPDFLPHGYCYRWQADVVWIHVVSDLLIALAYYFIPLALIFIVRRRGDMVYPWMFWLFGIFILACGTTHLMSIWVIWQPVYRLDGLVKAITALASVPTAILLVKLAPAIVALPSPEQLRQANVRLEGEIAERNAAEEKVRLLNEDLERRVQERTTELARVNERLRESEHKLHSILDSSPAIIFVKDLGGRYTFVNQAHLDLVGLRRDQVLGRTDHDVFPADQADMYRSVDRLVYETGQSHEAEEIAYVGEEAHIYLSTKFPLVNEKHEQYALCGVSIEITERKQAEDALRRYNEELGQFAHIAAHDLQEPLRTVKSYTQLLARRYAGKLGEDADALIRFATGGVDRMQTLIDDLQSYTEMAHREKDKREPLDLNQVVRDTMAACSAGLQESGAEITMENLPTVSANRVQMAHLFQNLISNAVKYRANRPLRLKLYAVRSGRYWEFVVKDNGIGFSMEYAEQIFGLFKRLHGREYPGTGIGLAICKKVIESYGGRIWAVSEPGEGTEFHFTLPV